MPDQILRGDTFVDGQIVDGARLNKLADDASALKGMILEQTNQAPDLILPTTDRILYYNGLAGDLRSCLITALPAGVTTINWTATPSSVLTATGGGSAATINLSLALKAQPKNTFLSGPETGGNATPQFRKILPCDTSELIDLAGTQIDCRLGNAFRKNLSLGNNAMNLHDGFAGQRIWIYLQQSTSPYHNTVGWNANGGAGTIRWENALHHTMSEGGAAIADIVEFRCLGSELYYGTFALNFQPDPYP